MKTIMRLLPGLALALVPAPAALGQRPVNEHSVAPGDNTQDKGKIATLHFDFQNPRMLEVGLPGVGKRVVWYMKYWVSNYNDEPFTLYPEFVLMTNRNTLHTDQDLPDVF